MYTKKERQIKWLKNRPEYVKQGLKKCITCGVKLIYNVNWKLGYNKYVCKKCVSVYMKQKYISGGWKKCLKRAARYRLRNKMKIMSHYSPDLKCVKCGFSNIYALSVDHINVV